MRCWFSLYWDLSFLFTVWRFLGCTLEYKVFGWIGICVRRRSRISNSPGERPFGGWVASFCLSIDSAVRTAHSTSPLAWCCILVNLWCLQSHIVRYYQAWNHVKGKEFLECLNYNFGCFIAKFLNFKPSGVIVHDNEVDFPVQRKQIGCNSSPWTRWKRGWHKWFFRRWSIFGTSDALGHEVFYLL